MGLALKQPVFLSVVVEKVLLRGRAHKSEDNNEYLFEVGPGLLSSSLTSPFSLHLPSRLSILLLQPRPAGLTALCHLLSGLSRK